MKRLTHKFVKQQYKNVGYKLLSKEYKDSKTKNLVECPNGHLFENRFNDFRQGVRCPICAGLKKHTYKYVKKQINKTGWKLISEEYINSSTKLLVECPEGHQYWVTYNTFQQGHKCSVCYGNKKHNYSYIKKQFENRGCKLLSEEYKNNRQKLLAECPNGHLFETIYATFQQDHGCPICAGLKKHNYSYIKKQFEKKGWKLLSEEYKGANFKLLVECPYGHQYEVIYNNFRRGHGCPICWELKRYSRSEKACLEVVKQIIPNEIIIENDRTQIINPKTDRYLELDIWIPSLNKAIEFNGEYWHDFDYVKYKDNQKIIQCKEKNIRLLIINYQDWVDNREEQIEKLKEFIGE